jgi:hypothetical protein
MLRMAQSLLRLTSVWYVILGVLRRLQSLRLLLIAKFILGESDLNDAALSF